LKPATGVAAAFGVSLAAAVVVQLASLAALS